MAAANWPVGKKKELISAQIYAFFEVMNYTKFRSQKQTASSNTGGQDSRPSILHTLHLFILEFDIITLFKLTDQLEFSGNRIVL